MKRNYLHCCPIRIYMNITLLLLSKRNDPSILVGVEYVKPTKIGVHWDGLHFWRFEGLNCLWKWCRTRNENCNSVLIRLTHTIDPNRNNQQTIPTNNLACKVCYSRKVHVILLWKKLPDKKTNIPVQEKMISQASTTLSLHYFPWPKTESGNEANTAATCFAVTIQISY